MQSSLLVQVRETENVHAGAVARWGDMTVALLHGGGQIIKMILDVVRLIICNFSLVDLGKKSDIRQRRKPM
jgi:hypothetical protein